MNYPVSGKKFHILQQEVRVDEVQRVIMYRC
jgi:hypothetical protein